MKRVSCLVTRDSLRWAAAALAVVLAGAASGAAAGQRGAAAAGAFTVPVQQTRLKNGLRVVVSPDHSSPIVVVEVMYNIGFRIEPKGRTGFAHLFEHMMFQGSAHVGKAEHIKIVQQNGGQLNGSTRFDYTNYFEVMPSNTLALALWLEADRMRSLKITPENLKNQQNVVSEEVRVNVLNSPYAGFEWLGLPQRANTNWYNAHNFYGDLAEIDAATIDDVQTFFDTYYTPGNAVLVVVGDTTFDEVVTLAEHYFGDIPPGPRPPRPDVTEPPQTAEKAFEEPDMLARMPAIALGYHVPPRMSREFFALSLLDPLLVGDESARLYQALIKQRQVATSMYGGLNLLGSNFDVNGPMLYTLRIDYKGERTGKEILAAVDEVIGTIQRDGITAAELDRARTAFKSMFFEEMEGGMIPGFGKSNLLGAFALFDGDAGRINTILPELDKVTPADVQRVARTWLVPTNRTSIDRRPVAPAPTGGAR